ncbi:MAG: NAD-dependent epimerase/dehydratase family protein [Flavobacteriales bacterium]
MAVKDVILVIGASGQIGSDLVTELRKIYGNQHVVASDIKDPSYEVKEGGPFILLDIMDELKLNEIVSEFKVTQVYLLAAMLSATAERNIELGWQLNMRSISHVLDLARSGKIRKLYWPSSIAIFGSNSPSINTPQHTITEPSTVYGISKLAGERWCQYYNQKFGVDVRSLRYPGLVGWSSPAGGGTTDYAVEIYSAALQYGHYQCFLKEDTRLPMMYMPDAIRATIELMEAPADAIKVRSSYNIHAMSFTPNELAASIQKHIPDFTMTCEPDYRQAIAESWPASLDDSAAVNDWAWKPEFDIDRMTADMLRNLKKKRTY